RRRRGAARADHRNRRARDVELPALRRRAGNPHPGRCRAALWRPCRCHHLHGCTRPVFRHQSAVLVFLDRDAAGRRGDLPAQWHSRRGLASSSIGAAPDLAMSALSTRGLNKSFGSLVVARDVKLDLPPGARYALIGPNGAGKTTLINLITGMIRPDRGHILLGDEDITALAP